MNETCIQDLPEEIKEQLAIIDKSQSYIIIIIAAVILSYYSISIQRKQLICSATDPEMCKCLPKTLPIQATSSILIIGALLFFFQISENTLAQSKTPNECNQNSLNHLSSALVLIAAMVRFGLLVKGNQAAQEEP